MNLLLATISPTVDTLAYATGDLIGGKLTLPNVPRQGIIQSLVLVDQAKQSAAIDVVIWRRNPGSTTFTDQVALDVADADLLKLACVLSVAAADYDTFADNGVATLTAINVPYEIDETGQNGAYNLYACLVSRGTPTFVAGTDVQLQLGIISE